MKIYNPVRYIPKEEYDRELEKYVEHVLAVPGLEAIYTLGSVNVPGLSDLDVVCVVKDDIRPSDAVKLNIDYKKFNPEIFLHGPLIFPESLAKKIPLLLYTMNFNHVWSRSGFKDISHSLVEAPEPVLLSHVIDQAEQKLDWYRHDQLKNTTDKRRRLRALNFFLHVCGIFEKLNIPASSTLKKGADLLRGIRERWQRKEVCSDQEFFDLYRYSDQGAQEAFLTALDIFYKKCQSPEIKVPEITYQVALKKVICSNEIKTPRADRRHIQIFNYRRLYMKTHTPISYAFYLECNNDFKSKICNQKENDFLRIAQLRKQNVDFHNQFLDLKEISFAPRAYTGLPRRLSKRRDVRLFDRVYWFFERLIVD